MRTDLLNQDRIANRVAPVPTAPRGPRNARKAAEGREWWRIARALRCGDLVTDRVFDDVFPAAMRTRSRLYWTPVDVAVRAANLLADKAGAMILDIGSGVGKFCIVAGAVANANVHGIEHRPHLVQIARDAAAKIGVPATFDGGTIEEQDASVFDGFYLFNPFAENFCAATERLDETVELSMKRFNSDIDAAELLLSKARVGARVVTYCGFGGEVPDTFDLVVRDEARGGSLDLWVKRRA